MLYNSLYRGLVNPSEPSIESHIVNIEIKMGIGASKGLLRD